MGKWVFKKWEITVFSQGQFSIKPPINWPFWESQKSQKLNAQLSQDFLHKYRNIKLINFLFYKLYNTKIKYLVIIQDNNNIFKEIICIFRKHTFIFIFELGFPAQIKKLFFPTQRLSILFQNYIII